MTKYSSSQKGIGIVGIIILVAISFAILNIYTYFNPSFSLSKYTLVNILSNFRDQQRIKDLENLEKGIEVYFQKNSQMPTYDGWCGRVSSLLRPELANQIKELLPGQVFPHDPAYGNTSKDYFYYRVDRTRYVLMAVLDNSPQKNNGQSYNFKKCHDWPGDDVYNYQIKNF